MDSFAPLEIIVLIDYWTITISDALDIVYLNVKKDKSASLKMD